MKIQCPDCKTGYQVDDAKIPDKGAYVRCRKCQTRFLVQREIEAKAPESERAFEGSISAQEKLVDGYIEENNQEKAVELLSELITRYAVEKNFIKADALRDKLYEVAPFALNEIIKTAEIIAEEKRKSLDPKHLELWADLYESLTPDETIELFYSMKELNLKPGQAAFKQGQHNSNLYFVQEGFLKLCYDPVDQEEIVLKELSAGEHANMNSFFSYAICTHTLVAATETKLTYLEKDILTKWKAAFPGIEVKLDRFCHRKGTTLDDLVQKVELDLRAYKRVKTTSTAIVQLLDDSGQPLKKPFKVSLLDISAGGVGFTVELNRKEEADRLLDRFLILENDFEASTGKQKIAQKGRIVAVNLLPFGKASVHVRFETPLDEKVIETIEKSINPE